MVVKVSKDSVRTVVHQKRLPRRFKMFVIGAWLYDVLKANGLHEKFRLWNQTYWVVCRSLDARHLVISWRVDKC
jgi:hypothetical protein